MVPVIEFFADRCGADGFCSNCCKVTLASVRDQARLYDSVAVAYHGPKDADTNFPITPAMLEALGEQVICKFPVLQNC
jgi:hypothetical protein